jgi:hypothetical protein
VKVSENDARSAPEPAQALDWYGFSARHFPGRPRHDWHALAAYEAYRDGREWSAKPGGRMLRLVPHDPAPSLPADEVEGPVVVPLPLAAAAVQVPGRPE